MNDCIFCKIARGDLKAKLVHQDDTVVAFEDINPQAPVHYLIIPKKHIDRISSIQEQDVSLIGDIHRVAMLLAQKKNLDKEGFRLVTNDGKDAGQSVGHLHYHLLGGRKLTWPPG